MLRCYNSLFCLGVKLGEYKGMKINSNKIKEAVRIITLAAQDYDRILNGKNYIFIFKNRINNQIEYFESVFLPRNFQHLTGVDFINEEKQIIHNSTQFYHKCIDSALKESEIRFKEDGTTELKLRALPMIVNFLKTSKMTAVYNAIRPMLSVERLAGTTNFCLGFTKDKEYYVPSSCLFEDIRNLSDVTFQILAILSKPADKKEHVYKDIRYVAKGVEFNRLSLPEELKSCISLENYHHNQ